MYAAGRPLWHVSLTAHVPQAGPLPLVRWTAGTFAKMQFVRDTIMQGVGTAEAFMPEKGVVAMHWRKPLAVQEINRMAPTPEVRARAGRP